MKRTLVLYETKPASTRDNERLIERAFHELREKTPESLRYMALKLEDGIFVHFTMVDANDGSNPLVSFEAFQAFQSGIKDRCTAPPRA